MKTIKKNVYYCGFCKKKGLSSGHMKVHEKHCTANPDRECRLCGMGVDLNEEVKKLKSRFKIVEDRHQTISEYPEAFGLKIKWAGAEITMDEIGEITDGCLMCKLALMRQSELTHYLFQETLSFDYKDELKQHWAEKSAEQREVGYY